MAVTVVMALVQAHCKVEAVSLQTADDCRYIHELQARYGF